jgi:hypothetical protein
MEFLQNITMTDIALLAFFFVLYKTSKHGSLLVIACYLFQTMENVNWMFYLAMLIALCWAWFLPDVPLQEDYYSKKWKRYYARKYANDLAKASGVKLKPGDELIDPDFED